MNNNPVRYNDPSGHFAMLGTMAIGGLIGALSGAVLIMIAEVKTPDKTFTAQDYAAAVLVGAAAGTLIGSGVGVGAGTAMAAALSSSLIGAGTGAAGSAIGYTLAAGSSYDSSEMAVAAGIGSATGAISGCSGAVTTQLGTSVAASQPVLANAVIQAGLPILNSQAQTLAFHAMDGEDASASDYAIAPIAGGVGGTFGFVADVALPGAGAVVRPLLANGVGSFLGNWWQGEVEKIQKRDSKKGYFAY
jgi:hypothetical protein